MLQLNPLFTSGAVLAEGRPLRVFGETDAASVSVCLSSPDGTPLARGEAPAAGHFEAELPPVPACAGCTLTVCAGEERFTAEDVAVGLLLLCGGQSNMELELQNCAEGPALIPLHSDPLLRYFNVPKYARACPEADAAFAAARWQAVRPGGARDMSAIAYFAARRLREASGKPVGMVDCYWGGTSVTCWMDEDTLLSTGEGRRYLEEFRAACGDKTMEAYLLEERAFQREMDEWNAAVSRAKERLGADAPWAAIEAEAGVCPWHPPVGPGSPFRPAGLYHTMLRRAAPLSLSGAMWYQGEEDTFRTARYDVLLESLLRRWRGDFRDPALPFAVMQLPQWQPDGAPGDDPAWPALRLAQAEVCAADSRAVCVCQIDQGEQHNIHPVHKRVPGERMAEAILPLLEGKEKPLLSPAVTSAEVRESAVELKLSLPLRAPGEPPAAFELRGEDGVWRGAEAEISGSTVRVRAEGVPRPAGVRYAWFSWGRINVFGTNGWPMEPFVREEGN